MNNEQNHMTTILEHAFKQASSLPEKQQDELGYQLIQDIESELGWGTAFEKNQTQLEILAEKALTEYRGGKTRQAGFDEL